MRYISLKMLWENYFYSMFERLTPSIIKNPDQLSKITEFHTLHDDFPCSTDYYNEANCSKCVEEFVPFKVVDVIIVHEYIFNETCKIRRDENVNSFKIRINKFKRGLRKFMDMNHDRAEDVSSGLYRNFLIKLLNPKIEGVMPYLHIHDIPQLYDFTIDQEELTEDCKQGEYNHGEPLREPLAILPAEDNQHKRIGDFNAVSNDLNETTHKLRESVSPPTDITFKNIKDPELKTNEGSNCNKINKQNSLSEKAKPLPTNLNSFYVQVKPPDSLEKSNIKGATRDINEQGNKPKVLELREKEGNLSKNELNSEKPDGENISNATLTTKTESRMAKHKSSKPSLRSNVNSVEQSNSVNNAEIKDILQKGRSNITVKNISKEPLNVKGYGNTKPLNGIYNEGNCHNPEDIKVVKRYMNIKNMENTGSKSSLIKMQKYTSTHINNDTVDVTKDKIINKYKSIGVRPAKTITNVKNNISTHQEPQINVEDNKMMHTISNNTTEPQINVENNKMMHTISNNTTDTDVIITEYDLKPIVEIKSSTINSLKGDQISDINETFGEECNLKLQKLDITVKPGDKTSVNNFHRPLFPKKEISDVQMVAFKVMDDEAHFVTRKKHLSSGKGNLVDLQIVIEDEQAVKDIITKPKQYRRTMSNEDVHKEEIASKISFSKPWKRNSNQKENGSYKINISKSDSQVLLQKGNLKNNSASKSVINGVAQVENTPLTYSTKSVKKVNAFKNSKTNPGLTVNAPFKKVKTSTEENNLNAIDNLNKTTNEPKLVQNQQEIKETVKNKNHDSKVINVQSNENELGSHMPNTNKNMGETVIKTKSLATFNNVIDRYKAKSLPKGNDKEAPIKTIKSKQEIETRDNNVSKNTHFDKNNKSKTLYIKTVPSRMQITRNTAKKTTNNTHIQEVLVKQKVSEMIKTIKSPKEKKNILSQNKASTAIAPTPNDFDTKLNNSSDNNNLDFISNKPSDKIGGKIETVLNNSQNVNKKPNLLSEMKKTNEVKKFKNPIQNPDNQKLKPTVSKTLFQKVLLNVNSRNKARPMSKSFLNNTPAGILEQKQLLGKLDNILNSVSVDKLPQNKSSDRKEEYFRVGSNIRKSQSQLDISNKNVSSKPESHNAIRQEKVKIISKENEKNNATDSLPTTHNGERSKKEIHTTTFKSHNDKLRSVAKVVYEPVNYKKKYEVSYSKNKTEKPSLRDVHLLKNKSNIQAGKQKINETPTNTNIHKNVTIEKSGKLQNMLNRHIPRK